jgi:outer membrane protein assembly factor BamB
VEYSTVEVGKPPQQWLFVLIAAVLLLLTGVVYLSTRTLPSPPLVFPQRWSASVNGSLAEEVFAGPTVVASVFQSAGVPPTGYATNSTYELIGFDLGSGRATWSSAPIVVLERNGGADIRLLSPAPGLVVFVVVADALGAPTPGAGTPMLFALRLNASTGHRDLASATSLPPEAAGAQLSSDTSRLLVSWATDPWPNPASATVRAYDLRANSSALAPVPPPGGAGSEIWSFTTGFPPSLDGIEPEDLVVRTAPGHIIVEQGYANRTTWVLNDSTGHLLWQRDLAVNNLSIRASTADASTLYTLGHRGSGVEADRWSLANGSREPPIPITVPADRNTTLWITDGLLLVGSYVAPGYYAYSLGGTPLWQLPLTLTANGSVCRCSPGGQISGMIAPIALTGSYALLGATPFQYTSLGFVEPFRVVNLQTGVVAWSATYHFEIHEISQLAFPRIYYPVLGQGPLVIVRASDGDFVLADFTPYLA